MKNIQVIDGAMNEIFEIYEVSEELFQLIFPGDSDIAFWDDVERVFQEKGGDKLWALVYKNTVDKKKMQGIHGTLHLIGSPCRKEYFPTRREDEVHHSPEI